MKKKLFLITEEFPYEHGEDTFVGLEYPLLCEQFDVRVITTGVRNADVSKGAGDYRNVSVISPDQTPFEKICSIICFLMHKECYQEILDILKSGELCIQRIFRELMYGTAAVTFFRRLKKVAGLAKDTEAIFYFYWFDYRCFALCMNRKRYPDIRIITRTHGRDLYDERELYGKQFFKPQMDKNLDRIIFAAQYAKDYYLQRYHKNDSDKYLVHRLGVASKMVSVSDRQKQFDQDKPFLILSCSGAIPLKRIELIIEGLSNIHSALQKIHWVHIGDGDALNMLKELAEKKLGSHPGVEYCFMGQVPNEQVLEYYRHEYVGCFITTTETEGGAPVAVQEALSFGVPVIATAVGELPFMVEGNGLLCSENADGAEIGDKISQMASLYGTEEYWMMCQNALNKFDQYFNAEHNFSEAVADINKL